MLSMAPWIIPSLSRRRIRERTVGAFPNHTARPLQRFVAAVDAARESERSRHQRVDVDVRVRQRVETAKLAQEIVETRRTAPRTIPSAISATKPTWFGIASTLPLILSTSASSSSGGEDHAIIASNRCDGFGASMGRPVRARDAGRVARIFGSIAVGCDHHEIVGAVVEIVMDAARAFSTADETIASEEDVMPIRKRMQTKDGTGNAPTGSGGDITITGTGTDTTGAHGEVGGENPNTDNLDDVVDAVNAQGPSSPSPTASPHKPKVPVPKGKKPRR